VAAAGPALVYLAGFPITETSYRHLSKAVFEGVAPLLLLVGLVTSIALYARRDPRAPWVALLLLIPDGLLFSRRLSGVLTEHIGRPLPTNTPSWALMATVSVVAVLVGLAALALALALASRRPAAGTPLRS
jgi:hypothetical protein